MERLGNVERSRRAGWRCAAACVASSLLAGCGSDSAPVPEVAPIAADVRLTSSEPAELDFPVPRAPVVASAPRDEGPSDDVAADESPPAETSFESAYDFQVSEVHGACDSPATLPGEPIADSPEAGNDRAALPDALEEYRAGQHAEAEAAVSPPETSEAERVAPQKLRTRELEAVAQRADAHSQRGFNLAGRGAFYAARAEFTTALRMMADALDAHEDSLRHSQALAAGLHALREADDFLAPASRPDAMLDATTIAEAHDTPVARDAGAPISPLAARQSYYNFAQAKLAEAAGGELASSMALYGLGKVHVAMLAAEQSGATAALPKAMVFHQAALTAQPNNALAANELAVLLARIGRLEQARDLLQFTVAQQSLPEAWHNLAYVHRQLREHDLAQQAEQQQRVAESRAKRSAKAPSPVQWVSPEQFARSSEQRSPGVKNVPAAKTAAKPVAKPAAESESRFSLQKLWPFGSATR